MFSLLKIGQFALGILNTLTNYFTTRAAQNTGKTLQQASDFQAQAKEQVTNAQIGDNVSKLTDDQLNQQLRNAGGGS